MNNADTTEASPIALLKGEAYAKLPKDLYIPPDAMEVFLEAFEGPLDLLLYLIRKQNLDILDIPIAEVTRQYMEYVDLMKGLSLELAAEYLVMAAILAEIKSRMLLPRPKTADQEEADPRGELIRRLQEYERIKQASEKLDQLPRQGRDHFVAAGQAVGLSQTKPLPVVTLPDLVMAFADVIKRADLQTALAIQREPLSVHDRCLRILDALQKADYIEFSSLFSQAEGRPGAVVSFLATLELLKDHVLDCVQAEPFAPIHLKAMASNAPACYHDHSETLQTT